MEGLFSRAILFALLCRLLLSHLLSALLSTLLGDLLYSLALFSCHRSFELKATTNVDPLSRKSFKTFRA